LLEPFWATVRIFVLCITLIVLQKYRYFQIFMVNALFTMMLIYIGWTKPFADPTIYFFEMFNECFIALTNYHMMCFADFVQDDATRNILGWSMIGIVGGNLVINVLYIVVGAVKDTYFKLRTKYYQWKNKNLKARLEKNAELKAIENAQRVKVVVTTEL
jgi:hypothetical protein